MEERRAVIQHREPTQQTQHPHELDKEEMFFVEGTDLTSYLVCGDPQFDKNLKRVRLDRYVIRKCNFSERLLNHSLYIIDALIQYY